jgi:hypothetical protein
VYGTVEVPCVLNLDEAKDSVVRLQETVALGADPRVLITLRGRRGGSSRTSANRLKYPPLENDEHTTWPSSYIVNSAKEPSLLPER